MWREYEVFLMLILLKYKLFQCYYYFIINTMNYLGFGLSRSDKIVEIFGLSVASRQNRNHSTVITLIVRQIFRQIGSRFFREILNFRHINLIL